MILQTSHAQVIENVLTLAGSCAFDRMQHCDTLAKARSCYVDFLKSLGQRDINGEQFLRVTTEADAASPLRLCFSNDSLLDDRQQAAVIGLVQDADVDGKRRRILQALDELRLYDPNYCELFETIITDIFILPSTVARGGSTSQAVGLIWLNPRLSYALSDIIEMLVHEFTHHAMFLDELRQPHYAYDRLLDRSTWTCSAILNTARPLDKVLHSIVVSTEVLLLRLRLIGHPAQPRVHPPSQRMARQLHAAIAATEAAVQRHHGVFAARGLAVLANSRAIFESQLAGLAA